METLTTIHDNMVTLSHAHIDWSLNGGVVWLLGSIAFSVIGTVVVTSWSK
jgi:hypothetical protein